MNNQKLKICKKHGETEHVHENHNTHWRCKKCRSIAVSVRRKKLKLLAVEYKGGRCERCGYNKSVWAFDFHHLDPTKKDFAVGSNGLTRSWEKVKAELDKCILVCSNCHREIHEEIGHN
jgi:hypothetical protein